MSEERITQLEERIAYLERFLEELSVELSKQVDRIDGVYRHLEAQGSLNPDLGPHDEKPPHY